MGRIYYKFAGMPNRGRERLHREVTLHELEKLKELINFQDRYFEIDTSWFPATY